VAARRRTVAARRRPSWRRRSSAALRVEWMAWMRRRPPQGQRSTSMPKVCWWRAAQSSSRRGARFFLALLGDGAGVVVGGAVRHLRAQGRVRGEDTVEGREVKVGRRHQGDEALHQGLGRKREGVALLGVSSYRPSSRRRSLDSATGPCAPYRTSRSRPCLSWPWTAVSAWREKQEADGDAASRQHHPAATRSRRSTAVATCTTRPSPSSERARCGSRRPGPGT